MKKTMRMIAMALIIAMSAVPAAYARSWRDGPWGHDGRHWHDDDDWSTGQKIAVGAGIAVLLAAIFSASNKSQSSAPQSAEKKDSDVRTQAQESAKREADSAAQLIGQYGINDATDKIISTWEKQERKAYLYNDSATVSTIRVSGFSDNMKIEYVIDRGEGNVTARVTVPDYDVKEEYSEKFAVPSDATSQYVGFTLRTHRDISGYPVIDGVARGTFADLAGMRSGDLLIKIGANDLKNADDRQVGLYIIDQANKHALTDFTFSRSRIHRTVSVQL
jgi:C-terminal processing protease CtpA/Prc